MSVKVYANLIGNWVCLNDSNDCKIGLDYQDPYIWHEEGAIIEHVDINNPKFNPNSLYSYDRIKIHYQGKTYEISPLYLQIVK